MMDRNRLISIGVGFVALVGLVGLSLLRAKIGVEVQAAGSTFLGLVLWQSQKLVRTGTSSKEEMGVPTDEDRHVQ